MSNNFDDLWDKHIKSELARTNEYNQKLNLAQNKLVESSLIGLIQIGIEWLEKEEKIDSKTANIMRTSVSLIDNIFQFCIQWF